MCAFCVIIALLSTTAYSSEEMTRFPVPRGAWPQAPPRVPGPRQIPHPSGRFTISSLGVLLLLLDLCMKLGMKSLTIVLGVYCFCSIMKRFFITVDFFFFLNVSFFLTIKSQQKYLHHHSVHVDFLLIIEFCSSVNNPVFFLLLTV